MSCRLIKKIIIICLGNPFSDPHVEGDPYNTLFVGRLNYSTTEERISKEFSIFGKVLGVRLVRDKKTDKSKGYAFVEFKHKSDADYALRKADNRKIDGFRILVDREFGRTKKDWLPRRLGGGKGD